MNKCFICGLTALAIACVGVPGGFTNVGFPAIAVSAAESGECGEGVSWSLDGEGLLTVSGSGKITSAPWDTALVKNVVINDGITAVCDKAFYDCRSLETIDIPASVTKIGEMAFGYYYDEESGGSEQLSDITVFCDKGSAAETYSRENSFYFKLRGVLSNGRAGLDAWWTFDSEGTLEITGTGEIFYSWGNHLVDGKLVKYVETDDVKHIVIGEGITAIDTNTFFIHRNAVSVSLPSTLKVIGEDAFCGCESLTEIEFPLGLEEIGMTSFFGCPNLKSVMIPRSVTRLSNQLPFGCDKDSRKIPGFTIYGFKGSSAEEYANNRGFDFVALEYGDIDSDGNAFTVDDLVLMQKYVAGWNVAANRLTADIDDSRTIDIDDVILLQKAAAGWKVQLGGAKELP